jgi:hypothetical protein
MRNKNRYQRNRSFRQKYWNHCRSKTNPYEHTEDYFHWTSEERLNSHLEWIGLQARAMESGIHKGFFHATASFRRAINRQNKAKIRNAMKKINNGDYDTIVPNFKRDADWLYF